jgi:hypothetical protein
VAEAAPNGFAPKPLLPKAGLGPPPNARAREEQEQRKSKIKDVQEYV